MTTAIGSPFDVIKTHQMTTTEKLGMLRWAQKLYIEEGLMSFAKGFLPSLIRVMPHTILTFVFLEQLRVRFGKLKADAKLVSYNREYLGT